MPRTKALISVDPLVTMVDMDVGMLLQISGMSRRDVAKASGMAESTLSKRLQDIGDLRIGEWVAIRNVMRKEAKRCGHRVPDIVLDGSVDMQQLRQLLLQES